METKMKGLLKGLRYISQIFDSKEPEMQIGYPTDVKHVAHIGWDNQATNNGPSWMTDFKPGEPSPCGNGPANWPPSGFQNDYQARELTQDKQPIRPPHRTSGETASPKHDMSPSSRQTQRRHSASSSAGGYGDSPSQELNDGSGRNRKCRSIAGTSGDSSQPDAPAVPKQNRRRKTKGSSGGGSGKSKPKSLVPAQELEVDEESVMMGICAVRPQTITGRGEGSF